MPTTSVNSIRLNYLDTGTGSPVVLVHGFPLDHQMWAGQVAALSDRHRVIAPDLRGFGGSDVTSGTVSMAQFADDVAGLLDVLGITEPVAFCGLSMGGYVAWQFWQRHRARLAKLVLCDTRAAADSPETARGRLVTAEQVLANGPAKLVETMSGRLFAAETLQAQPELVAQTRRIMTTTSREGIAAALRGMAERADLTPQLAAVHVPTLVICGEQDIISPVAEMRGMAAAMPRATFIVVPGAGHMAPLEQPALVNPALRQFLAEPAAGS